MTPAGGVGVWEFDRVVEEGLAPLFLALLKIHRGVSAGGSERVRTSGHSSLSRLQL